MDNISNQTEKNTEVQDRVHRYIAILALFIVLGVGLHLRLQAVFQTYVIAPVRSDAADYVSYAYNMTRFGVYSRTLTVFQKNVEIPEPDAVRNPGYALMLIPFLHEWPSQKAYYQILIFQAILSTLTIALIYSACRTFLPYPMAIGAAGLTAISPHLINMNVYLLTESLYTFLLVLSLWVVSRFKCDRTWPVLALGILFGCATLTRPTMQYFFIFTAGLMWIQFPSKTALRSAAILLLGFILVMSPWFIRNIISLGNMTDDSLIISTLHHGMYPDFMFENDPNSYGFPYRFDPRSDKIVSSRESVLGEIKRRFTEEPAKHLRWYFLGKPKMLWSWNIVQGIGDTFIYPVRSSPYFHNTLFKATHRCMYYLHWFLVVLGLLGAICVWFPRFLIGLNKKNIFLCRLISLLLLYHTAILIIGAPFPRYSIPLRPLLYAIAMLPLTVVYQKLKSETDHGINNIPSPS